jgi:hypothetical protein
MLPRRLGPGLVLPLTDVVDLRALYRLSQAITSAQAFLIRHVRGGLIVGDAGGPATRAGRPIGAQADFGPAGPPRGIFLDEMTIALAQAPGGGSLLRVDAYVAWYPSRSAAEHIDSTRFRAVTVTVKVTSLATAGSSHPHVHVITRTFTQHSVVARIANIVNDLPAMPDVVRNCTLMLSSYALTFTPVSSRWPRIVVASKLCSTYGVTVGGRVQPPVYEAPLDLTDHIRKLVGLPPLQL